MKMRYRSVLTGFAFWALALTPTAFGKPALDDVREYYSKNVPLAKDQAEVYFADRHAFEEGIRKNLAEIRLLPTQPQKADEYIAKFLRLYGVFYGVVFRNEPIGDKAFLLRVMQDEAMDAGQRQLAAKLLYIDSGDVDTIVKALLLAPSEATFFTHVKDAQFADVLSRILAGSAAEEVRIRFGDYSTARPYTQCLNNAFGPLVQAVFFQKANSGLAYELIAKSQYLKAGKGFNPIPFGDTAKTLRETSLAGFRETLMTLFRKGQWNDIRAIQETCQDADSQRIITECVEERSTELAEETRAVGSMAHKAAAGSTRPKP